MNGKNNEIIFSVTVDNLQKEAVKLIGRKLTDGEFCTAVKGVEAGLFFDMETVYKSAIEEAIS